MMQIDHGGPPSSVDKLNWPTIEPLLNGSQTAFAPIGGQWIATRKYAYTRLHRTLASPSLSTLGDA